MIQWRNHNSILLAIIESVDSNVGIARTRNIWPYIKISPNLKNGELISLYDNILLSSSVFMTNKTPTGARKHRESTQPNSSKTAKLFFFLLLSFFLSSDGLAQYCVNLSRWFTHETAAFSTEQCTTPSLFHNFEASLGACSHSLKHYGFQFGTPFSLFVLTHAHLKIT